MNFYPTDAELDEMYTPAEMMENLPDYHKSDTTVVSFDVDDLVLRDYRAETALVAAKLAQTTNLDLSFGTGRIELTRPKTAEELLNLAKQHLRWELSTKRRKEYEEAEAAKTFNSDESYQEEANGLEANMSDSLVQNDEKRMY